MLLKGNIKLDYIVTDEYYLFFHSLSDKERVALDATMVCLLDIFIGIIKEMRAELDKPA